MGYPVLESIYGGIGVFYAAIFNIAFNILVWTVGVMLFTGGKGFQIYEEGISKSSAYSRNYWRYFIRVFNKITNFY